MDSLPSPSSFPFPYEEPYSIQKAFMSSLFECLEGGKLGIFESPTGTGKSLSIICGAVRWFKDREEARMKYLEDKTKEKKPEAATKEGEDWFAAAVKNRKDNEQKMELKIELKFLRDKAERISQLRKARTKDESLLQFGSKGAARKGKEDDKEEETNEMDEDLLLLDCDSEEEEEYRQEDEEEKEDYSLRIYYASRTHSQLSQFVKEVKKSPYADRIRLISLGSRRNTCINEGVKALRHNTLINEKCLELQKDSKKTTGVDKEQRPTKKQRTGTAKKCPHYSTGRIEDLKAKALTEIIDIEELVSLGRKTQACPYYSSRHAAVDAEIVVMPYNTLLHKSTRDTCGVKLKNSIVIIDEAHNLLETLAHIHSSEIKESQLKDIESQLSQYLKKFRPRLKPKNILNVKQLIFIVSSFIKILTSSRMMSTLDFLHEAQIFNINLVRLLHYISKSKLAFKLRGFTQRYQDKPNPAGVVVLSNTTQSFLKSMKKDKDDDSAQAAQNTERKSNEDGSLPLNALSSFLACIIEDLDEGRVLVNHSPTSSSSLKFLLLNPANHFKDLVRDCHSIIVAGGTMEPVEEFKKQLFLSAGGSPERIHHFSCGHVIPESHLLPLVLHKGPSGRLLDFSFTQRSLPESYLEILRLLTNLGRIIPGGIVVFFPSYDYESKVHAYLNSNPSWTKDKPLFREPKTSDAVEGVLKAYARAVKVSGGAFLFSVVGGKMSEGINFSDDLGRAVVMIGLPFANAGSIELKEKMEYLNRTQGSSAGQEYYENSCMKAVNQSIGRAIRHSNDYATIVLADHRYARDNIVGLLPSWIRDKLWKCDRFGPLVPKVTQFFKSKKS